MNNCDCCSANIFNEEDIPEPLASSRTNSLGLGNQALLPINPNPSYVIFPGSPNQNLYDYDDAFGHWTVSNPTTITISKTGNYGIGLLMNIYFGIGPGTVVCQVHNLFAGPIGGVPPILSTQNTLVINPSLQPGFYVGVASGYANAHLVAGSTIRIAYITSVDCQVSPTSAISITLLEGKPGPAGIPGPPAPSVNIYNSDGALTQLLRTVDVNVATLAFSGILGSNLLIDTATITLQSGNIVLPVALLNDNLQTQLVVRDVGTGQLLYRDASSFPSVNIYNSDGAQTDPLRTYDVGAGNELYFKADNGAAFRVFAKFLYLNAAYFEITSLPPNDENAQNVLVRDVGTGELKYRTAASLAGSNIGLSVRLSGLQSPNFFPFQIKFDQIALRGCYVLGITYNAVNGETTILTSGIYVFQAQIYTNSVGNFTFGLFDLTNVQFLRAAEIANPNQVQVHTIGCTLQLTAGDQLAVYCNAPAIGSAGGNASLDTYYSLHLI